MISNVGISSAQICAARGLLGWSQEELATAANLSIATIRKIELGHISPRHSTTHLIRAALEDAGLEFLDRDGVRRRPNDIIIYQGQDGAREFYDDVFATAQKKGGETVIVHPSAKKYFVEMLGSYSQTHIERMMDIKDRVSVKCLVTDDKEVLPAKDYCEYRYLSKHFVDVAPSYVYDDKYAPFILEAVPSPKIVVIQSRAVAETFRHQFYSMWEKATSLNPLDKHKRAS